MTFQRGNTKGGKLTGEQVVEIREKYALEGWTQSALSRAFQVSISTIRNILNGTTWQQIEAGQGLEKRPRNPAQVQSHVTEDEVRAMMERAQARAQAAIAAQPVVSQMPLEPGIEQAASAYGARFAEEVAKLNRVNDSLSDLENKGDSDVDNE